MATTGRDYYEILGVDRSVGEAEIKKAFRQLARELHPDVSEAPDADERFKEVVEAYEVLSKSETRQLYDRFGHAGLQERRLPPDGVRFREPRGHLLGLLRRRRLRRRHRPAESARSRHRGRGRDRARGGRGRHHPRGAGSSRDALRRVRGRRSRAGHRCLDLRGLRRHGSPPTCDAHRVRRVHPQPGVPALQRDGSDRRAPLRGVRRRGASPRDAQPRRRDPAGHP